MELDVMDLEVDFLQAGIDGRFEAVPKQISNSSILPLVTLPVGLPPVLPDIGEELEEYLSHPESLPIHQFQRSQKFCGRERCPDNLYAVDTCPLQTTITVDRNPTTGELLGFKEEFLQNAGSSSKNSTSLKRPPGPPEQDVRGSSANIPFWPGGLDELDFDALNSNKEAEVIDLEGDMLTTPPGFAKGMTFEKKSLRKFLPDANAPSVLQLSDLFANTDLLDMIEDDEEEEKAVGVETKITPEEPKEGNQDETSLDEVIKLDERLELPGDMQTITKGKSKGEEWAVKVDINTPVHDFYKRIPDMAYTWKFELDVFQKQAILRLENHENVFVAAHTSAGKTVVAEYAIALSLKHMTRSVYTSPIKALSNQKFRDFKTTFQDVGLITGDVQINTKGSCLIMTTEILRSMLYNGSDVIRDLEWVIFDEVHYINDADRGVVWEEVLIMLPDHVNIILLSATVPNTMEFADWVGRIKKRNVYVVSTQKRPVPLEHFLYTGNSNKTSNELFVVVDSEKKFITSGYTKAVEAKKERTSKQQQGYGPKGGRTNVTPQQEKNIWLSVIDMLRKKEKLPVVCFTFSKKRIDDNAHHLSSVDLTTEKEKSEVHIFFQKCVSRLKGTDRQLPQVKHMQDLLKRGLGVHHSGILPILKEVVEMLFQKGLVKVLLATETFAMGVNMPARTVVFDSIRKHDGKCFRDLLPGEYVQMAGRAGRRGLDSTGTVIILCKADVPEMADLHKMMLGKPTLLQSQFRLTYTMILNLLRVEQLRVEDMMKRSFSEFHNQKDVGRHKEELQTLLKKMSDLPEVVDYYGDLEQYYLACEEYHELKDFLQKVVMSHPQTVKALSPGRLVIVNTTKHRHSMGVILQPGPSSSKTRTYTALMLCEQKAPQDFYTDPRKTAESFSAAREGSSAANDMDESDSLYMTPVLPVDLFHPEGPCSQEIVTLKAESISVVTTKTMKINAERIIDDIKKRQQPRFRNDPPGQSTSVATQELLRLIEANPRGFPGIDPVKDLHIRDVDLVERFRRLKLLEETFDKYECTQDPAFDDNFKQMRANKIVHKDYQHIKFLLSDESLQLLPEYQQRIEVLQGLSYIDRSQTVQLKGRVACEISNHELIITEMVFDNILTTLHPTEIAALLSCVVFEQRRCSEPNLAPDLLEAKKNFLVVARKIGELQKQCGVPIPVEDYLEKFNFGLVEVVFEWARGMPFADITQLTDVQEGIIVRAIQRLDEVLKDVRNAARIIGDPVLYQKMEESSQLIKRDIVFAASLYTQ